MLYFIRRLAFFFVNPRHIFHCETEGAFLWGDPDLDQ